MKTILSKFWIVIALAMIGTACATEETTKPSLKDALDGKFYMGAALNTSQIFEKDTAAVKVVKQHFNSIVAENCMKSMNIQPKEGEFTFEQADAFVDFGMENDMYIVGHCLIWHSQAPRWFFSDEEGNDVSREVLIERMKTHISALVGRYKGKVDAWDVVNEAFEDDGSWRKTKFLEIIGEDFIKIAFQFAHEADPEVELMYNDYSMYNEGRRNAVVELIHSLQADGIPIHGIGMQAHYGLDNNLPLDRIEKSILAFAETGVDVHFTELDISVLPSPWGSGAEISTKFDYEQRMNPYPDGMTDSINAVFNDAYLGLFKLLLKHEDKVKRVTTWGVADHHSWKNNWPIRGRTDYCLLFDRNNEAKPVVDEIIAAAGTEEE